MSRSVSYANNSVWVFYSHVDFEERWEWDDYVDDLKESIMSRYPSMDPCDKWLGREDHAILENAHAYIGLSEYCGLVSIWCAPKGNSGLHQHWAESIGSGVMRLIDNRLVKVGVFSNGEAIFQRSEGK